MADPKPTYPHTITPLMSNKKDKIWPWVLLAFMGLPLFAFVKFSRYSIGCPLSGDCYLPGWNTYHAMESIFAVWMLFGLPMSLVKIIGIKMLQK